MPTREELITTAREKAERAAKAHRVCKAEFARVLQESGLSSTHPEDLQCLRRAIRQQAQATEEFYAAVRELHHLLFGHTRPADSATRTQAGHG